MTGSQYQAVYNVLSFALASMKSTTALLWFAPCSQGSLQLGQSRITAIWSFALASVMSAAAFLWLRSFAVGVVGMLEVIQSDFARLESEANASEAMAQKKSRSAIRPGRSFEFAFGLLAVGCLLPWSAAGPRTLSAPGRHRPCATVR
jgi:hypothetical protein